MNWFSTEGAHPAAFPGTMPAATTSTPLNDAVAILTGVEKLMELIAEAGPTMNRIKKT